MKRDAQRKAEIDVGTIVRFMFGGNDVQATVVEDRGSVGAKGRRILRVRLELESADPMEFESRPTTCTWTRAPKQSVGFNARDRFLSSDTHRKLLAELAKR